MNLQNAVEISSSAWRVTAAATAGVGLIWATISPDSILPLIMLASGAAVGVVYLWRSPETTALKSEIAAHRIQIDAWEERLSQEIHAHDVTREHLGTCKSALMEAGARIRELEAEAKRHRPEQPA